jgi:cytochrome c-type biogenesis protein CcmH/NrfF
MNTLLWVVIAVAVIFLIVGGTVKAINFLLWIAPILLIVAVIMFLMNRSRGRRGV